MKRPNPWIALPVLVSTIAGGVIGFQVTRVSCAPAGCIPTATVVGIVAALAAFFGVGTVMVLAVRSIAEWREQQARGGPTPSQEDQGPPTC